jgi:hypothetical protein
MKFRLDYVALPVFLLTLAYNSWHWGSSAQLKDIGPVIAHSAAGEAPLVQTYTYLGKTAIDLLGLQASALVAAESTFGPAREKLLETPELAMETLFEGHYSSDQAWLTYTHWICPLFLLLFVIGWLIRPKQIRTIRPASRVGR